MPAARTPGRWPYRAAKPVRRRRVIKAPHDAPRGVRPLTGGAAGFRITRLQARMAAGAAAAFMLASAGWYAYHSPWLTVSHVTIAGTSQVTPEQVQAAAQLRGESVFGLNLKAAQERITALPKVRSATVKKTGWNSVTVTVEGRVPWGSWQINGVNVPIDVDGYVLDGPAAPAGSPVIVEVDPRRVLKAGDRLDPGTVQLAARLVKESETAFGRRVRALVYRQTSGLTAVLSGAAADDHAIWVTFGDARDYDYKVAALYVLLERAQEDDLALNAVDLRFGDRMSFN